MLKSFAMAEVLAPAAFKAVQHGKPIFYMTASFQTEEQGLEHQDQMPNVVGPEQLKSISEYYLDCIDQLPPGIHDRLKQEMPIEMRPVELYDWLKPQISKPINHVWMKASGEMPDDPRIHKYMLAYASDFQFLPTALHPHGVSYMSPDFQLATIDHAMWFHRDFRFDDWLLYSVESPSASGGRGLVRGQIFNREGVLVASTIQEGVMRKR